jgi:AbrB family looped-hinge helix DNA binding protein
MPTNVTSKGQVTIPKPFRDRLGITTGTPIDFELAPDGANAKLILTIAGAKPPPSRFTALRGRATSGMSTDEIMALFRGGDDH